MCVSACQPLGRLPQVGQAGDGLVGQVGESIFGEVESVGVVLPESPGDDVLVHVESERLPAVGGGSLEADDLTGLVRPVVRVAPSVGGSADGLGDALVGGDVLSGGGHCVVLSTLGWVACPPRR